LGLSRLRYITVGLFTCCLSDKDKDDDDDDDYWQCNVSLVQSCRPSLTYSPLEEGEDEDVGIFFFKEAIYMSKLKLSQAPPE
jgi:hypothetical protein